jgi:hypothetical protein
LVDQLYMIGGNAWPREVCYGALKREFNNTEDANDLIGGAMLVLSNLYTLLDGACGDFKKDIKGSIEELAREGKNKLSLRSSSQSQ